MMHGERDTKAEVENRRKLAWAKRICLMLAALSFLTCCVLVVAKMDPASFAGSMSWAAVVVPTVSLTLLFTVLWMIFHYMSIPTLEMATVDEEQMLLKMMSLRRLHSFRKASCFRSVLLIFSFGVLALYGMGVYMTNCDGECNTPLRLVSLLIAVSYIARALMEYGMAYSSFYRMVDLGREVHHFQDTLDADRFYKQALPDAHKSKAWGVAVIFQAVLCLLTLALSTLEVVWLETGDCKHTCAKVWYRIKFLSAALFLFEAAYLLSVILYRYMHRVSGMLALDTIVYRTYRDSRHMYEDEHGERKDASKHLMEDY